MNRPMQWLSLIAITLLISACASNNDNIDDSEMAEIDQTTQGTSTAGVADSESFEGEALEDPSSPLSERIVYFGYDSSNLSNEAMNLLEAHGEYLADNSNRQLLVEGHTDERGAREYNLALGERRAEAVKQALMLSGARDGQISTVSYGEESPAMNGSSEAAWSQNRRAELLYER